MFSYAAFIISGLLRPRVVPQYNCRFVLAFSWLRRLSEASSVFTSSVSKGFLFYSSNGHSAIIRTRRNHVQNIIQLVVVSVCLPKSPSTCSKANVSSPKCDINLCCIHWSVQVAFEPPYSFVHRPVDLYALLFPRCIFVDSGFSPCSSSDISFLNPSRLSFANVCYWSISNPSPLFRFSNFSPWLPTSPPKLFCGNLSFPVGYRHVSLFVSEGEELSL